MAADRMMILVKKVVILGLYISRIIGASFCQVSKIMQFVQFRPSITSGNQAWKGAAPNLVRRAEFIIISLILLDSVGRNSFKLNDITIENKRIVEARA